MKHLSLAFVAFSLLTSLSVTCAKNSEEDLESLVGKEPPPNYKVPDQPRPVVLPRPPEPDAAVVDAPPPKPDSAPDTGTPDAKTPDAKTPDAKTDGNGGGGGDGGDKADGNEPDSKTSSDVSTDSKPG
jgi:hypothetical protein